MDRVSLALLRSDGFDGDHLWTALRELPLEKVTPSAALVRGLGRLMSLASLELGRAPVSSPLHVAVAYGASFSCLRRLLLSRSEDQSGASSSTSIPGGNLGLLTDDLSFVEALSGACTALKGAARAGMIADISSSSLTVDVAPSSSSAHVPFASLYLDALDLLALLCGHVDCSGKRYADSVSKALASSAGVALSPAQQADREGSAQEAAIAVTTARQAYADVGQQLISLLLAIVADPLSGHRELLLSVVGLSSLANGCGDNRAALAEALERDASVRSGVFETLLLLTRPLPLELWSSRGNDACFQWLKYVRPIAGSAEDEVAHGSGSGHGMATLFNPPVDLLLMSPSGSSVAAQYHLNHVLTIPAIKERETRARAEAFEAAAAVGASGSTSSSSDGAAASSSAPAAKRRKLGEDDATSAPSAAGESDELQGSKQPWRPLTASYNLLASLHGSTDSAGNKDTSLRDEALQRRDAGALLAFVLASCLSFKHREELVAASLVINSSDKPSAAPAKATPKVGGKRGTATPPVTLRLVPNLLAILEGSVGSVTAIEYAAAALCRLVGAHLPVPKPDKAVPLSAIEQAIMSRAVIVRRMAASLLPAEGGKKVKDAAVMQGLKDRLERALRMNHKMKKATVELKDLLACVAAVPASAAPSTISASSSTLFSSSSSSAAAMPHSGTV